MKSPLFLLIIPVLLAGCSTVDQRPLQTNGTTAEPIRALRFANDGSLIDREDLERYCEEISSSPQTVVIFMHGWHGSASANNQNIQSFQTDLAKVRERTYTKSGRKLTGICLTWNARMLPGVAEYPMYYFTRNRADRVAQGEGISLALKKLSNAMRRQGREHIIVAGHSMGGRILGRVVGNHPELLSDVDLILLVNSADNSSACVRTVDAVNAHPYLRGRLPKLLWVTSAKDAMTGPIYEFAERSQTPGHDKKLLSYDVKIEPPGAKYRAYGADVAKISDRTGKYAHNIRVVDGLGGHGDIWSEAMIQIVNYYVLR
jgi:pimeloyl-ACP methyl ester carboxylesterase